jgi:folylpolyglutamate synthase/dihydropteroate synthase
MGVSENSALALAQAIVETHDTGILGVVSALNTKQMNGVRGALDTLTTALYTHDAATINEARVSSCPGNYASTQSVDLYALAPQLIPTVPSVMTVIETAVVTHKALNSAGQSEPLASGVAIKCQLRRPTS